MRRYGSGGWRPCLLAAPFPAPARVPEVPAARGAAAVACHRVATPPCPACSSSRPPRQARRDRRGRRLGVGASSRRGPGRGAGHRDRQGRLAFRQDPSAAVGVAAAAACRRDRRRRRGRPREVPSCRGRPVRRTPAAACPVAPLGPGRAGRLAWAAAGRASCPGSDLRRAGGCRIAPGGQGKSKSRLPRARCSRGTRDLSRFGGNGARLRGPDQRLNLKRRRRHHSPYPALLTPPFTLRSLVSRTGTSHPTRSSTNAFAISGEAQTKPKQAQSRRRSRPALHAIRGCVGTVDGMCVLVGRRQTHRRGCRAALGQAAGGRGPEVAYTFWCHQLTPPPPSLACSALPRRLMRVPLSLSPAADGRRRACDRAWRERSNDD